MLGRTVLIVTGLAALVAPRARAERTCEELVGLSLARAAVTEATLVPAGPFTPPPDAFTGAPDRLPAYCRVQGIARPSGDSEIHFEVWLPEPGAWNGKFEQSGNGGFAGSIPTASLAGALARGYASAGTDDGHTGPDPSFAIGHPEKVVDFGHRAVHETAVQSKAIVEAYYGRAPVRSYFFGCSDGGREALMEAQRYPGDFEGIIAGAPAARMTALLTAGVWNWKALTETPGSAIPVAKLVTLQRAVQARCDRLDGLADGLIDDPRRCRFDPAELRCAGPDRPDCLTPAQVAAAAKIYHGPTDPGTGKRIFPGAVPGAEAIPGDWDLWLVASEQMPLPLLAWFGTAFYRSMVFEDSSWDYRTIDFDRDVRTATTKWGPVLDADDPDLRPFRDRGGKLIQYHGWGDAAIAAPSSIDYYERVVRSLGGSADVADFYRLFLAPGMGHCAGGVGPNDFGNTGVRRPDPARDVDAALDRWVEKGVPPDRIVAAGVRPGNPPNDPAKATPITRVLCPYPRVARYRGRGSTDRAESFACVAPAARAP